MIKHLNQFTAKNISVSNFTKSIHALYLSLSHTYTVWDILELSIKVLIKNFWCGTASSGEPQAPYFLFLAAFWNHISLNWCILRFLMTNNSIILWFFFYFLDYITHHYTLTFKEIQLQSYACATKFFEYKHLNSIFFKKNNSAKS